MYIESAESTVTWIVQLLEGRKKDGDPLWDKQNAASRVSTKVSTKLVDIFIP